MSGDKWKKERNRVGLIVEEFPLEKGNSYHWTVRIKETDAGEIFFLLLSLHPPNQPQRSFSD